MRGRRSNPAAAENGVLAGPPRPGPLAPSAASILEHRIGGPAAWQSNTIAVLPFVNVSADPENEYFSDGLTEELIHALARLPSVRITARRSAFRFKGTDRDIREIGRLLGAGKIVEGSVRKADDRLRITVQLVNVADGYQLWSEKYDRTMNDVFALQEEIAGAIRLALWGRLGEGQVPRAAPPTRSVDALNHYLLGRFHWNKRNEAGFRAALAHFREAIQIDPDYGRAYSGLADCYVMLAMSGAETPAACMPLARQAALRALEIDDRLVEAHTSLGVVRANFDWDWSGSEIEFQRALECDPSYATLHHWYSLYSLAPGAFRRGRRRDRMGRATRSDLAPHQPWARPDALSWRRLPGGRRPMHEGAQPRWTLLSRILVAWLGPRPARQFRGRKRRPRNGQSPGRVAKLPFGDESWGPLVTPTAAGGNQIAPWPSWTR